MSSCCNRASYLACYMPTYYAGTKSYRPCPGSTKQTFLQSSVLVPSPPPTWNPKYPAYTTVQL